ncbi:hypothetical protein F5B20DRAFT_299624 [Whalleya microplaca]|nr:hypothetical protein F5B20DRAFT_299624 [Whalleya microplaca]
MGSKPAPGSMLSLHKRRLASASILRIFSTTTLCLASSCASIAQRIAAVGVCVEKSRLLHIYIYKYIYVLDQ